MSTPSETVLGRDQPLDGDPRSAGLDRTTDQLTFTERAFALPPAGTRS
ncbi:hypothetical protein [Streptomyces virginiae]